MREDFKNDFTHARRALAAGANAAQYFIEWLASQALTTTSVGVPIDVRLKTNADERGVLRIRAGDRDDCEVTLTIGDGVQRPPGALPTSPHTFAQSARSSRWIAEKTSPADVRTAAATS